MADVSCDFESRAAVDLRKSGVYPYAAHPDTDVWCFSFFDPESGDILTWTPDHLIATHEARQLRKLAENPDQLFRAWNAQFERIMWREIMVKRYGFPEIALERWRCTMAEAAALSLPRSLDSCAIVLKVKEQKDKEGAALMLRMAKPRKVTESLLGPIYTWWDVPDRVERLIEYNKQDVRAEMAVKTHVRDLSPHELKVYQLDQRINDRGIMLDSGLARAVARLAGEAQEKARQGLADITSGAVTKPTQINQLKAFLADQGTDVESLNKDAIRNLLAGDGLSDTARRVLELRSEAGKTSVRKVQAMFACVGRDERMRGLLLYHGAGTGRWAGKLIQPQNFPARSKALGDGFDAADWIELVRAHMGDTIELSYPLLEVLAMMLRPCLRAAPGMKLIGADFAAIEARVLAWLAGETWLIEAFAKGQDVYKLMAADIYRKPVDQIGKPSAERDMGKRVVLGCGFQMGPPKFVMTCAKDDVAISESEAQEIVDAYRNRNARIKALWYELDRAAVRAVERPGERVYAAGGKLIFVVNEGYLKIVLPSRQRALSYYSPKVVEKLTPWGSKAKQVRFQGENSTTRTWQWQSMYGGLITENVVQAIARDLMVDAMFRLEDAGYRMLLSVHDEGIAEVPEFFGCVNDFQNLMAQTEPWAAGLPVKAEGWEGPYYAK